MSASRWLRRSSGLQQVAAGGGGQEWIVSRAMSAYAVLDGRAVPPRKRAGYASMWISRWAPFPDPQWHIEWVGDQAMVWAWSRQRLLQGSDGEPLAAPRRVWPESLFRGAPALDGEELVRVDEGVEGRVWKQGVMAVSQWWPDLPALEEWNALRRGAGLQPAARLPDLAEPPLASQPWKSSARSRELGDMLGGQRRLLLGLGVAAACATLAALLVGVLALKVSIWDVERQLARHERDAGEILAARDAAHADAAEADRLLGMRPPAGQIELLALVAQAMGGSWQLLQWTMTDDENLRLTAKLDNPDPRALVMAWEKTGRFADVTAALAQGQGQVEIRARVLGRAKDAAAR